MDEDYYYGSIQLRNVISTTISMVEFYSAHPYVPTKALEDAKIKIPLNNIVVIVGNEGDGRSTLAVQLMAWLYKEKNKTPFHLFEFDRWDRLISPKLHLAVLMENMTGKTLLGLRNLEDMVLQSLDPLEKKASYLIITILPYVYKEFKSCAPRILHKDNVIDLGSEIYDSESEKLAILDLFSPIQTEFVPFSADEKKEILKCAPKIGFPRCCRLFKERSELQRERVGFFRKPVFYIKSTLSDIEDGRCVCLLYLFFVGGEVHQKDLNFENGTYDKSALEKSTVNLVFKKPAPNHSNDEDRLEYIKESLDFFTGSMVRREQAMEGGSYCYKFAHEAVMDTVGVMYHSITPIGYMRSAPVSCLHNITTTRDSPNKLVIEPSNTYMYERILQELKGRNIKLIASLDLWKDKRFVTGFLKWLREQKVDKDWHLSWTEKETKLYYSAGNGEQSVSNCSFLSYAAAANSVVLLKRLMEKSSTLHEQIQYALNQACSSGAEDCALYLLSEGIKPDQYTLYCVVEGGSDSLFEKLADLDFSPLVKVSKSPHLASNINILHEACLFERELMVKMLANKYPSLVHETDLNRKSTLHLAAMTGNCSLYQALETFVFYGIGRQECEQKLCHLVDDGGKTVLHYSCDGGHRDLSIYLCQTYAELMLCIDTAGWHCLHFIAKSLNKLLFSEFYSCLQDYCQFKQIGVDVTSILTNSGKSVFDVADESEGDVQAKIEMCDFLIQFWSSSSSDDPEQCATQ